MKIYNTLTRKKEEFKPIKEGHVGMYVCGPTVYNLIHIGNARPMIVFDTFRRYMIHRGYDVNYVSNFTDVDDKIINRAQEEGMDPTALAEKYIDAYFEDSRRLRVLEADVHPRVTRHIGDIIKLVQQIIDNGHAYEAGGDVYFDVRSLPSYGELSGRDIDDMRSGARVEVGEVKRDPLDFALWKAAKEGEICWDSPWGKGRPGWHIECSVMSKKYLGDEIDIHAGGEDLVFPHHENEIAQSEAANGKQFARYWMHNAFLNIDGVKMSKSLGNFRTVRDVLAQYDPQVLRFFMLSAQYRSPLNFSAELMDAAKNGYERIVNCAENLKNLIGAAGDGASSASEQEQLTAADEYRAKFEAAMDDDFNTADAVAAIFELVKFINSNASSDNSKTYLQTLYQELQTLTDICGLIIERKEEILDADIEALIAERQQARKDKNFARADEIRDELLSRGIELKDTREGVQWKRI